MFVKYKALGISQRFKSMFSSTNIVAYDKDWQYPAITEQHAFEMMRHTSGYGSDTVYVGFPWATLIDFINRKNKDAKRLLTELKKIKKKIKRKKYIVTVCQHVDMLKHQELFYDLGITHIFWSHTIKDQKELPLHANIKLLPFPLYPVQAIDKSRSDLNNKYLYSFVGAKSQKWYLTQSRNSILDILSQDDRGYIQGRDSWHYEAIVYEYQVKQELKMTSNLLDNTASEEFKEIVSKSIFSLCPSGSGPNSIRLWESIGLGSIPVILADTYLPPGNLKLWDEAVVYCDETEEAIYALPNYLETMANDPEILAKKRHAMRQLWMIYGPDCFVYDIKKLFLSFE